MLHSGSFPLGALPDLFENLWQGLRIFSVSLSLIPAADPPHLPLTPGRPGTICLRGGGQECRRRETSRDTWKTVVLGVWEKAVATPHALPPSTDLGLNHIPSPNQDSVNSILALKQEPPPPILSAFASVLVT